MIPLSRALLFLIGCIGTRGLFAYAAYAVNPTILPYLGALALLPAIGWLVIVFIKPRDTGIFGKIWWKNLRIFHAISYLSFAVAAFMKSSGAWKFLAADTLFGLFAFLLNHFGGWQP
jgi:hypothetical protein